MFLTPIASSVPNKRMSTFSKFTDDDIAHLELCVIGYFTCAGLFYPTANLFAILVSFTNISLAILCDCEN